MFDFDDLADDAPEVKPEAPAQPAPEEAKQEEAAPQEQEEAAEGDVDDPFAMMGGMGEEQVYKVTLLEEKSAEAAPQEQEEAAEGDVDDPFAMMGGMGEEQVYKVTLLEEKSAEAAPQEQEEAVECDCDDPLAMMAGMGEEEVYKVTLMDEKSAEVDKVAATAPAKSPSPSPSPVLSSSGRKILKLELGHLTEKNVGQLMKLNHSTFPVTYQSQFYQDLLKYLDYSRLGFYADVLVSSICCRLEERPVIGGRALYIMTLSVLKPYQRRSIASQLIQWAVEKAQTKEGQADDIQEIYLHVQTSNEGALAFYKTFGFEVTEEIKNYYKKIEPPDCYVLRKVLNGGKLPPVNGAVN